MTGIAESLDAYDLSGACQCFVEHLDALVMAQAEGDAAPAVDADLGEPDIAQDDGRRVRVVRPAVDGLFRIGEASPADGRVLSLGDQRGESDEGGQNSQEKSVHDDGVKAWAKKATTHISLHTTRR